MSHRSSTVGRVALAVALAAAVDGVAAVSSAAAPKFPLVKLPPGFKIEKVVGGLTFPTSIAWDDKGGMYVAEAGGQFLEEPPPARILRVAGGRATPVVNLTKGGVADSVVGLVFDRGAFYVTGRDPRNRTGAIFRASMGGKVTKILTGFKDSQSEHQLNDIRRGPDGRLYFSNGPAANSAVVGIDLGPFVDRSPRVHTTTCHDYVLTGQNFETPDFRTKSEADKTQTGAFVPFGVKTRPGQRIKATKKCGGAIFSFSPAHPERSLRTVAFGFRNVIGFAWNKRGQMFASVNSYDVRGSRPVNDDTESTYLVRPGAWYGEPDYTAALRPVTLPKYDSPDALQAPIFVAGKKLPPPKKLGFLIDHAASGLRPPDPSLVVGVHEIGSSPSEPDVAPASWGRYAGQIFVPEWGDLAPGTSPLRNNKPGYRVVVVSPGSGGKAIPFVRNAKLGPASELGALGAGIERPLTVRFGPDGAMYIVDYGVARVNFGRLKLGQVPYEFPPHTGSVWRVTPPRRGSSTSPSQTVSPSFLGRNAALAALR